MKKILSVFLIVFLMFTSVFTGVSVIAEENGIEATLYNPIEIELYSIKKYENAYLEVELDAVFTHEDGTVIKTPGFWKESTVFAVRFNPTKIGTWNYVITCSDTDNEKLHNIQGKVICKENDGSTEFEKHGFIKISENKRYFTYDDGTPFFWLGDTNWQAPNYIQIDKCNYPGCKCGNQFKHEVDNRKAKGFNVYQTYFDSAESDGGGQRGKLAGIWSKKFTTPNTEVFNKKIDYMFKYLYENDMVAALGFGVHKSTTNNIKEADFLRFVRYIVARYSCYSIAWISGQEVTENQESPQNPGKTALDMYMAASELAGELDGYKHPNGTHMYPLGTSDERVMRLDKANWHQWWAVQAGHGASVRDKKFYQSYFISMIGNIKPYIEAEANYEDINCGGFTGYDANRYSAWNAILNGCCGFTYGVSGIWANCYANEGNTGWFGPSSFSYEPWYMGIDKPGSYEVKYMKEFFEALPDWSKLVPRFYNKFYADFASSETKDIATTEDMTTVVCYFQNEDTATGTLKNLDNSKTYNAYWFNPLTGKYIPLGKAEVTGGQYQVPEKPTVQDWVFLLTSEDMGNLPTEKAYIDIEPTENNAESGNIVTPYKVTAVGGVYLYEGKNLDETASLYDMKGDTAWEPLSDRVTQTIIYDLGTAYSLTHLNIVPATGTILPKYRIEGSNDGSSWTILVNTALRDARMSKDGTYVSETLAGNYRYVKVLLLNAEDIPEKEAKNAEYMVTYNEVNSNSYYSHTAIAEISVFASGVADVTIENVTNDGNPITNPENVPNGDVVNNNGIDNGVIIIAVSAAVGIGIGIVVAVVVTKKKEKN